MSPLATPVTRDLVGSVGTRNVGAVAPTAAARPYLSPIPRQLGSWSINGARISRTWTAVAAAGGETCPRRHISSPGRPRQAISSDLGDMLIFTPGDLKSVPPSELHGVSGPNVQSDMHQEPWSAVRGYSQCANQPLGIRPFSGTRPILDVLSMAAALEGDSADVSNLGARHGRGAQAVSPTQYRRS